jgi:hypothetical protein
MVQSKLDNTINYIESKTLDEEDKQYDATLYSTEIYGVESNIALGQGKYDFVEKNIVFFPLYYVVNDEVVGQIGVYEVFANTIPNITDEDGDIDLSSLDEPLLYSFVNEKYFNINNSDEDKNDDENDDKDEDEDEDHDKDEDEDEDNIFDSDPNEEELPEQNEGIIDSEKKEYLEKPGNLWVQEYFKSNKYNIIDNEGGGDCLFAVIRDAIKQTGKDISVKELRKMLADETTDEIFKTYKEIYDAILLSITNDETSMKLLVKKNKELRERLKESKDPKERLQIAEEGKKISQQHKQLKNDVLTSREMINEYIFLKKVKDVEGFKKAIQTCDFWADTWAISTLERILSIKLIILSSEYFDNGDNDNVLMCGQLNDNILKKKGSFEPTHYIIAEHTGIHYKLITYRNNRIFNFNQIPHIIKISVVNKCLEKQAGPYYLIPQFKAFAKHIGVEHSLNSQSKNKDDNSQESNNNDEDNGLFIEDIVFQFYKKSNNKPLPGKGNGEIIDPTIVKEFSALSKIPDWRRKLDNDYDSEFTLYDHKWKSVTHFMEGSKFKDTNKEFYLLFSLDSGSKISENIELAQAATSKTGKYKGEVLRNNNITMDPEYYSKQSGFLSEALRAKFSQNDDLTLLLKETKNAKLQIYKRGSEPIIANELMVVRKSL